MAVGEEVVNGLLGWDGDEDGAGGGPVVVGARCVGALDAVMSNSILVAVGEELGVSGGVPEEVLDGIDDLQGRR